jgi:hypothetical protein
MMAIHRKIIMRLHLHMKYVIQFKDTWRHTNLILSYPNLTPLTSPYQNMSAIQHKTPQQSYAG